MSVPDGTTEQDEPTPQPAGPLELRVRVYGLNPEEDDPIIVCDEVEQALGDLAVSTGWRFEVPYS